MPDTLQQYRETKMDEDGIFRALVQRQKSGKLKLYIEGKEELEDFFKTEETEQANQWTSGESYHDYYLRQYERNGDSELAEYFSDKHDKFGSDYVQNGKINVGLLRTVGLSEGVEFEIPETYSEETLKESVKSLKTVIEEVYKKFIRPVNVTTQISIDDF
jgi:predicted DNA-binding antitoxin AbrB/MazE fold protein